MLWLHNMLVYYVTCYKSIIIVTWKGIKHDVSKVSDVIDLNCHPFGLES